MVKRPILELLSIYLTLVSIIHLFKHSQLSMISSDCINSFGKFIPVVPIDILIASILSTKGCCAYLESEKSRQKICLNFYQHVINLSRSSFLKNEKSQDYISQKDQQSKNTSWNWEFSFTFIFGIGLFLMRLYMDENKQMESLSQFFFFDHFGFSQGRRRSLGTLGYLPIQPHRQLRVQQLRAYVQFIHFKLLFQTGLFHLLYLDIGFRWEIGSRFLKKLVGKWEHIFSLGIFLITVRSVRAGGTQLFWIFLGSKSQQNIQAIFIVEIQVLVKHTCQIAKYYTQKGNYWIKHIEKIYNVFNAKDGLEIATSFCQEVMVYFRLEKQSFGSKKQKQLNQNAQINLFTFFERHRPKCLAKLNEGKQQQVFEQNVGTICGLWSKVSTLTFFILLHLFQYFWMQQVRLMVNLALEHFLCFYSYSFAQIFTIFTQDLCQLLCLIGQKKLFSCRIASKYINIYFFPTYYQYLDQLIEYKRISPFIMLKQQQNVITNSNDPFANIFQEGMQEFIYYEREMGNGYVTRAQKHKQKIAKLQRDMNDPELKKQRNKERRQAEKNKILQIIETMSEEELRVFKQERKRKKQQDRQKVRKAMATGQIIMIDLVYQHKMNGKENKSLAKQIELIMKAIKHIDAPPSIHLCSFQGEVKTQLEKMGYEHWPISSHVQDIRKVGQKLGKKLIYLSPDAEQPLQKIEEDAAYILGGLIDRTIIKNASLSRARELGIQARRLPIRPFMRSRIVVNLDHVVLMVSKYKEVNDWKVAFDFGAPKRWKKDEGGNKEQANDQSEQQLQKQQKIAISQYQKLEQTEQK